MSSQCIVPDIGQCCQEELVLMAREVASSKLSHLYGQTPKLDHSCSDFVPLHMARMFQSSDGCLMLE